MTLALAPLAPVVAADGNVLWSEGEITAYGEMVYTEGDCWALAYAMSELMLPPGPSTLRIYTLGRTTNWWHVVVRVGEDLYLDAYGLSTGAELEEKWGRKLFGVLPCNHESWDGFKWLLNMDWNFEPRDTEAFATARALLLTHAPHLLKASA